MLNMEIFCPARQRLMERKQAIINRPLPSGSAIKVSAGDEVSLEDVIAEIKTFAGFREIDAAAYLGVKKKEIKRYLRIKEGERIYKDGLLAEKTSLFGKKKVLLAKDDGLVSKIDLEKGKIQIQLLPKTEKVLASCWGKIKEIKDDGVRMETEVAEIFGVCGRGVFREGFLKVAGSREEYLLSQNLDRSVIGGIVAGGFLITREAIAKALTLGVKGIISGGINYSDFLNLGGEREISIGEIKTDVGITIIATEGFGKVMMAEDIWKLLKEFDGRYAMIDGEQARLIVPLK